MTSPFFVFFVGCVVLGIFPVRKSGVSSRKKDGNNGGGCILHVFPFSVLTLHLYYGIVIIASRRSSMVGLCSFAKI